jgi:aryl-phospho-beta-D-glucosidase BglC (GH1 family)
MESAGPTGQIIPIATWGQIGRFDEEGILRQRYPQNVSWKLPPVYANEFSVYSSAQSGPVNPWADHAKWRVGATRKVEKKRYATGRIWWGAWTDTMGGGTCKVKRKMKVLYIVVQRALTMCDLTMPGALFSVQT